MSGDLLSSSIGAEKFSFKKLQQDSKAKDATQLNQDYNYFTELGAQVRSGDVEAAQQAMAMSLFSVQNDGSENAKNLQRNNSFLQQIQAMAAKVVNAFKDEGASSDGENASQDNNANQNGMLAPSKENVNEIKKILSEQGDDDITDEDIQMFLETNPEFSE